MKHYILILFSSFCMLCSCDKTPANGDLDGMWQLMEASEADGNGSYANAVSRKEDGIYWNFQLQLLMIHSQFEPLNGHTFDTAARFTRSGNKLDITATYVHFGDRDSLLADPACGELIPLGIHGNSASYTINKINAKEMVLSSVHNRLVFRKF